MLDSEKREILKEQLSHLYKLLEISLKTRVAIKGWCITVLLGVIVAILKYRELFLEDYMILFVFSPVVLFWLLETMEGARTFLYRGQAQDIEKRIANDELEIKPAKEVFIISKYENHSRLEKLKASFITAFMGETTVFFYLTLCIGSLGFIWRLFPEQFQKIDIQSLYVFLMILLFMVIAYFIEKKHLSKNLSNFNNKDKE